MLLLNRNIPAIITFVHSILLMFCEKGEVWDFEPLNSIKNALHGVSFAQTISNKLENQCFGVLWYKLLTL